MKAIISRRPGPIGDLTIEEIDKPSVTDGCVVVRIHAASVNPADFFQLTRPAHIIRSISNRFKSRPSVIGADLSGTVEAVGNGVTAFRPGDQVFGAARGAFAGYAVIPETAAIVSKPAGVSFHQAAALPIAAVTALQALRDHGEITRGQSVLINGASGGVGTFMIQLAKYFGAQVTAVCSTPNVEQARSLGADRVIDYTSQDFTLSGELFDLMLDIAGNRSWSQCKRVLRPNGRLVLVGAASHTVNGAGKTIQHLIALRMASIRGTRKAVFFIAKLRKSDLSFLAGLLESGQMRSVIDRHYDLDRVPDAMRYMAEGHARGKIVIDVVPQAAFDRNVRR